MPPSAKAGTAPGLSVVVAESLAELQPLVSAWEDLASAAIEPNPCYEPWMLQPAVRLLGCGCDLRFALVTEADSCPDKPPILHGFFPLELKGNYKRLPARTIELWQHKYSFLCVPLLRKGHAQVALEAFFAWLMTNPFGAKLMRFECVAGDGDFLSSLVQLLADRSKRFLVEDAYVRPLLRRAQGADAYLERALSRKHQKDLQKKEAKLAGAGSVNYVALTDGQDIEKWITEFLELEASGWKGMDGGAFGENEADAQFFREIARAASRLGRLMMLGLYVGGKPVALKCNFVAGSGSFAFKIAHDEDYARFSPGLLLESENIRQLHATKQLEWMDSCVAVLHHPMFERIWTERRIIQSVLVSTGSRTADFWLSTLPLLHWIRRSLARKKKASTLTLAQSCPSWPGASRPGESVIDDNSTEVSPMPSPSSICQVDQQEAFSMPRRPLFLYGPSGLMRRLRYPIVLFEAVRTSVREKGLLQTLRKSVVVFFRKLHPTSAPALPEQTAPSDERTALNLQPGEIVEVKSFEEILKTLDLSGKNKGLAFTTEMREFCGQRHRVFKKLGLLYNEYTREQRKVKNTVLLENVHCKGTGFGCDRACFHFWREAWLRRVSSESAVVER